MAQLIPSTLLYGQAIELINQLRDQYAQSKGNSLDVTSAIIKEIISRYDTGAGRTLTNFEPVDRGEPPHSDKMNRFWTNIQSDMNILQDQADLLRASAIFAHNFTKTEILKAQTANARLQNKLKTLQLFSQSSDLTIIKFGDSFANDEFIDWSLIDQSQRATLLTSGSIGLGIATQKNSLISQAEVRVLPSSNGFLGNNQEIQDPATADSNPVTKEKMYHFIAEDYRASSLKSIIDSEPNTWIEYEDYLVSDTDRSSASNLNFTYKVTEQSSNVVGIEVNSSGLVDWAKGPSNGVLVLELEIDLKKSKALSMVTLTPFGLVGNTNNPIHITSISVSETGTEWEALSPKSVWLVNSIDKQISEINDEVIQVGSASWMINGAVVRFLRVKIEQPKPIEVNVGHTYYIKSSDTASDTQRVEGPIPTLENPTKYYLEKDSSINGLIQKTEYFRGKRWVIGIRDLDVKEMQFASSSAFISKSFDIPGIVDRVAIEADVSIPSNYSYSTPWIKFWISPNDGANWYQISRVQDDYLAIPEILAFNDPTPFALREPGVGYVDILDQEVKSLRLKVELERPNDQITSTPILNSYILKVKKR